MTSSNSINWMSIIQTNICNEMFLDFTTLTDIVTCGGFYFITVSVNLCEVTGCGFKPGPCHSAQGSKLTS